MRRSPAFKALYKDWENGAEQFAERREGRGRRQRRRRDDEDERTFQLHATSLSLLHNVQRACGESGAWPATPLLITTAGVCTG